MQYSKGDTIEFVCHANPGIVLEVMREQYFYERFESSSCLLKWIVFPIGSQVASIETNRDYIISHDFYYYVLIGDVKGWVTWPMIDI